MVHHDFHKPILPHTFFFTITTRPFPHSCTPLSPHLVCFPGFLHLPLLDAELHTFAWRRLAKPKRVCHCFKSWHLWGIQPTKLETINWKTETNQKQPKTEQDETETKIWRTYRTGTTTQNNTFVFWTVMDGHVVVWSLELICWKPDGLEKSGSARSLDKTGHGPRKCKKISSAAGCKKAGKGTYSIFLHSKMAWHWWYCKYSDIWVTLTFYTAATGPAALPCCGSRRTAQPFLESFSKTPTVRRLLPNAKQRKALSFAASWQGFGTRRENPSLKQHFLVG